ncbi:MAG: HAMP domain-containing sensor histidine kinase [Clostridia bacterium]|nr:HAMP domain-containing sensor histidine kinase [Clostridia bacterium]
MKKERAENKRMTSIARRIHRGWLWRLFRAFVFIDIAILLLSLYGFALYAETSATGRAAGDIDREFTVEPGAADFFDVSKPGGGWDLLPLFDPENWQNFIEGVEYRFTDAGNTYNYPLSGFYDIFFKAFLPILIIEAIMLFFDAISGTGGAKRVLKPIRRMADDTMKLTRQPPQPPPPLRDLHDIEDAISSIEPDEPLSRLSMGDKELMGLEEAINDLLDRMREAYQEQTRFVSDASHELRTPIAVIQGYANMLDRWGKQDESILDESIAAIKSEAEHMKQLIERLLFLARGDSGRQKIEMTEFSLADLVNETFEEYEMIDKAHIWKLEPPDDVTIVADEGMIKQAVRILVDNAIKYTPENGAITLRAFAREDAACFSVQDTGIGIAPDDVKHIFERFFRVDSSRDGKVGGYGLGLSIADWIISRHNGFFEVMSWPGLGTRITVCLPKRF